MKRALFYSFLTSIILSNCDLDIHPFENYGEKEKPKEYAVEIVNVYSLYAVDFSIDGKHYSQQSELGCFGQSLFSEVISGQLNLKQNGEYYLYYNFSINKCLEYTSTEKIKEYSYSERGKYTYTSTFQTARTDDIFNDWYSFHIGYIYFKSEEGETWQVSYKKSNGPYITTQGIKIIEGSANMSWGI